MGRREPFRCTLSMQEIVPFKDTMCNGTGNGNTKWALKIAYPEVQLDMRPDI